MKEYPKNINVFSKKLFIFLLLFLISFSFIIGLYLGFASGREGDKAQTLTEFISGMTGKSDKVDFALFQKIWDTVKHKYIVQPVDESKIFYGALTGLVASLGDPYSTYLDPELTKLFKNEIEGTFEGIGAEIGMKNDVLTIIAPLPDSPAENAGLQAKDAILKIDGKDTSEMGLDYATSLIRGKKGTEVKLTILRPGEEETQEIAIKRDKINVISVSWELKKANDNKSNIGYIKITSFTEDVSDNLEKAINSFNLSDIKGIILDLRNNSGGYLESAISVTSEFIEEGTVVIEEFTNNVRRTYGTSGKASLSNYPMAVLINGGSASSSEIVAGALMDYEKATLIGEKSYGKGSVQEYQELSDGSSLKLTTARWLTPNGNSINGEGIEPDISVELTQDDYDNNKDPQLDKAIEVISKQLK